MGCCQSSGGIMTKAIKPVSKSAKYAMFPHTKGSGETKQKKFSKNQRKINSQSFAMNKKNMGLDSPHVLYMEIRVTTLLRLLMTDTYVSLCNGGSGQ